MVGVLQDDDVVAAGLVLEGHLDRHLDGVAAVQTVADAIEIAR